eukprot:TRINITY_DN2095_c0_g1_i5.p1 TRINITY_DN2095_c0_g1~~TRINITY_DN2095_c0_g1_i5.p1  ORF type:complete len:126 (-),score=24.70 TRINITY_DN2095_c0_g1_i5:63-413(-)
METDFEADLIALERFDDLVCGPPNLLRSHLQSGGSVELSFGHRTLLDYAVYKEKMEQVKILLAHGANPNVPMGVEENMFSYILWSHYNHSKLISPGCTPSTRFTDLIYKSNFNLLE